MGRAAGGMVNLVHVVVFSASVLCMAGRRSVMALRHKWW